MSSANNTPETPVASTLNEDDIGRVFRRVDSAAEDKFLLLKSHNGDTVSFITFQLKEGQLHNIADIGYFNGAWYEHCDRFSPNTLSEIKADYESFVAKRLEELTANAKNDEQQNDDKRKQYGKPDLWEFVGFESVDASHVTECVVWYRIDRGVYIIEAYDQSRLLASQGHIATAEPRFGMDITDVDAIYGDDGLIRQLLSSLKRQGS